MSVESVACVGLINGAVGKVEWFDAKEKGKVVDSKLIMVPDEYGRSLQLTNILKRLEDQLEQQTVVAQYFPHPIRLSLTFCNID